MDKKFVLAIFKVGVIALIVIKALIGTDIEVTVTGTAIPTICQEIHTPTYSPELPTKPGPHLEEDEQDESEDEKSHESADDGSEDYGEG